MADYIVQKGDTLSRIAKAHGMTVKQLAELNGIQDVNKLKVGQTLIFEPKNDVNTEAEGIERTMSDEEIAARLEQQNEVIMALKDRTISKQAKEEIEQFKNKLIEKMMKKYNKTKEEVEAFVEEKIDQVEKAYYQGVEAVKATEAKLESYVDEKLTAAKNSYNESIDNAESKARDIATTSKEKARELHENLRADVPEPEPEVDISTMSQEELLAYNDQLIQQLKSESLTGRAKREIKEKIDDVERTIKNKYNQTVDNAFDKGKGAYQKTADFVKKVFSFFRID